MNSVDENEAVSGTAAQAFVKQGKSFSLIWVIPIVAVLIGTVLIFKAVTEKGPVITISFETAEGLEAGKTKIKYKDLEIGQVESIKLSKDLKRIVVTATMARESKSYLNESTQFYVVKARFSGGVATGIGTLLSGSYIAIDPGQKGKSRRHFTGLEIPPVITGDKPGRYFRLKAARLESIQHGSPIYFKGIKVGQVAGYKFSEENRNLEIKVFVESPYDSQVYETTRFWFASGLDMVVDANGVRVDTQSLVSLVIGGLAFANPDHVQTGPQAAEDTIFPLFNSPDDAMAMKFTIKDYYILKFDHSVRGLAIGAPVEFRGFPIGKVVDISLEQDPDSKLMRIPVKIEVEPERIKLLTNDTNTRKPLIALERMIDRGLRAELATGNLITGGKFISFDFHKSAEPASLVKHEGIIELPTIPEAFDEMTDNLTRILDKISRIPYDEISASLLSGFKSLDQAGKNVSKAGKNFNRLVDSDAMRNAVLSLDKSLRRIENLTAMLEQKLPAAVDEISGQTVSTLEGIEKLTSPDSAVIFELKKALQEFSKTARSVRLMADQLERHPESLIQGKGRE